MQGVDAGAGAGSRFHHEVAALELEWANDDRWKDTRRDYTAEDVVRLRGPVSIEYTLARLGAERFGERLRAGPPIRAACARTDAQALRIVRAGLDALYVSRRNVADRPIHAGQARPDRSLGPGDSAPALVRHINNALLRTDHGEWSEGDARRSSLVPIVADAEAGPGGPLHAFERMKAMIEAGAAAVHFEDQIAVDTMPGRSGGKVLVPTPHFIRVLNAARLAADALGVPAYIIARTNAFFANPITSTADESGREDLTGERTRDRHVRACAGVDAAIRRAIAYAPYADLLWFGTPSPDLDQARRFAEAIRTRFPGKHLAYDGSLFLSGRWSLDPQTIARLQNELGAMGYRFQVITPAGWRSADLHTFEPAHRYRHEEVPAPAPALPGD